MSNPCTTYYLLVHHNVLQMPDLVAWTEHLREWLSSKVFKPLVHLLGSCHLEANRLLREAGEQQQLLPSIASVVEGSSNGSSNMGAAAVADAESMVQQLLNRCAALPAHQQEQMRPLIVVGVNTEDVVSNMCDHMFDSPWHCCCFPTA